MPSKQVSKTPTAMAAFQQNKPLVINAIVIFLLLPVVYLGIEYVAAKAYIPSYSYLKNFTSDLGVPYAYIDPATGAQIFSYQAQLMRLNFAINGFLYYIGHQVLLQATTPLTSGKYNIPRAIVSILYCLGIVLVAAVPGGPGERKDGKAIWHGIGALFAIGGANVNIILAGLAAPPATQPVYRAICLLLGSVGSAGFAIFFVKHGSGMDGFWQRTSIYPNHAWEFVTAVHLIYLMRQDTSAAAIKRE